MLYESIQVLIHSKKVEEDYEIQANLILSILKLAQKLSLEYLYACIDTTRPRN